MLVSVSRSRSLQDPTAHARFGRATVARLAQFCEVMVSDVWSPIIWRDNYRRRANFESCKYAALDFDDGQLTLEGAEKWCREAKISAIIGTSKSHRKEKRTPQGLIRPPCDRFRLVLPFSEVVECRRTYEHNMRLLADQLPCDPSCVDAARFFYPCTGIVFSQVVPGSGLAVSEAPDVADEQASERERIAELRAAKAGDAPLPGWITSTLMFPSPEGGRHKLVYRLGLNLTHAGYSESDIVALVARSPLGALPYADIERAVANGAARAREISGELGV